MLAEHSAVVVCHGVKPGKGVIAAKSVTHETLVKEVIAKHGRIDAVVFNDAHPRSRAR